jgi:hypothetical protein
MQGNVMSLNTSYSSLRYAHIIVDGRRFAVNTADHQIGNYEEHHRKGDKHLERRCSKRRSMMMRQMTSV